MVGMLVAIHLSLQTVAAFEYRESSPASLFPTGMAAHDPSLTETISNPAYLPGLGNSYLNLSGSRPYSLEEVAAFMVRTGASGDCAGAQISWSGFGMEGYREQVLDISGGVRPFLPVSIGIGAVYSNVSIHYDGYRRTRGIWEAHAAVLIQPFHWASFTFRQENILTYLDRARRDLLYPVWSAGAALRPFRGVDLLYGISGTNFGLLNTFALSARVFPFLCIVAGYQHETGSCGAAFVFTWNRMAVSYGFRYHQVLGMTHSLGVTISYNSRTFDSVDFGGRNKTRPDPLKKIDINNCTDEELKSVPVLSETERGLIADYRANIGPLSRQTLYQLGMKVRQVDDLLDYVYGLAEPEPRFKAGGAWRSKNSSPKGAFLNKKRDIFAKLLGVGVKATCALKLADLSAAGKTGDLKGEIEKCGELAPVTRKRIGLICGDSSL